MKAVVVTDFGAQPELADLPTPEPGAGEILVRVHAAGVNPFDWKVTDGASKDSVTHDFPPEELRVRVDAEVPLADAPAFLAKARAGHATGKSVIVP